MAWSARLNPWIYAAAFRLTHLPVAVRSRRWIAAELARLDLHGTKPGGLLLIAWGRLGDVLLELPMIRGLQRLFPGTPLVCLGRPETEPLLRGEVARFVPFPAHEWTRSPALRRSILLEVGRPWEGIFGDLHLFHGGLFYLRELIERLPARHKALYQGHGLEAGLAPWRPRPAGVALVPGRALPPSAHEDPTLRHLWHDGQHYLRGLHALLGREQPPEPTPEPLPALLADPPGSTATVLTRLGLEPDGYIACQPASSNPRKDYPVERWRRVWSAFPRQRFVLLGSAREARADPGPGQLDLRGQTSLEEAVHLIRASRAFVGLDSGLTHLSAHLGRPTLCLAQASSLGYFFPYPQAMGCFPLTVLYHHDSKECAGCLTTCTREPLWRTYRRGAHCLRNLAPEQVIDSLAALL